MAWCHPATSLYLSQCSTRPLSSYGVTRPQWVKWITWIHEELIWYTTYKIICIFDRTYICTLLWRLPSFCDWHDSITLSMKVQEMICLKCNTWCIRCCRGSCFPVSRHDKPVPDGLYFFFFFFLKMAFNSLVLVRCGSTFKSVISKHMLWVKFWGTPCELVLRSMPQNIFDEKSTLFQVMAWCYQATSHYLNQCWPRSKSLGHNQLIIPPPSPD